MGVVSALPTHIFRGPTQAMAVVAIWWEKLRGSTQIFEISLFSPQSAQRPRMDTRRIFQISVSFCVFLCYSALEAGWDFWVFVQFQAGLARFQGRFFRELCRSVSSISMLRQSRAVVRPPARQERCGGYRLQIMVRRRCRGWKGAGVMVGRLLLVVWYKLWYNGRRTGSWIFIWNIPDNILSAR